MTDTDTQTIDRYLLGRLPEADCQRLEARLLSDPELFERAEAAEDELLDRYARGEMEPDERRQLERHLLGSERMRERIAFARALAARSAALRDDPRPEPEIAAHRRRIGWGTARLAWAATLILAVAVAWSTAGVLRLRSDLGRTRSELAASRSATDRAQERAQKLEGAAARLTAKEEDLRQQLEAERVAAQTRSAELEKRQLSGGELRVRRPVDKAEKDGSAPPPATLFLGQVTRGDDKRLPTLGLGDARRVELVFDLAGARAPGGVDATLTRRGEAVWTEHGLSVEEVDSETLVKLSLPRQSLTQGNYHVELNARGGKGASGGTLVSRDFAVAP